MPSPHKEPLLHFVLAGALIFAISAVLDEPEAPSPESDDPRVIVVDEARLAALQRSLSTELGRAPSASELEGAVETWASEEAMYREAVALGLDRGDLIVRRRLIQNLHFVLAGRRTPAEPDDAQLRAYYEAHRDELRRPARYTVEHVFLSEGDGEARGFRAAAVLDALRAGAEPAGLGDPFLHGRRFERQTAQALGQRLGAPFAEALAELPVGEWSGPVMSTYGVHVVRVEAVEPGGVPPFDEARAAVEAAWHDAEQERLDAEVLSEVVAGYEVVRE